MTISRDTEVRIILENPNMLVPHYLMHSYLYYEKSVSVISDGLFDEICRRLDREWDQIEHWHKPLVDRDLLSASTGFHLYHKLPVRVRRAAVALYLEWGGNPGELTDPDEVNVVYEPQKPNYEDFIGTPSFEDFI